VKEIYLQKREVVAIFCVAVVGQTENFLNLAQVEVLLKKLDLWDRIKKLKLV
jgi:hypothetical protein